jgi:hypothetical protein
MLQFIHNHALEIISVWFIFSNLVGTLPAPNPDAPGWWKTAYNVLHFLAANLPRIFPQLRIGGTNAPTPSTSGPAPAAPKPGM